jgi:hypothetical protein
MIIKIVFVVGFNFHFQGEFELTLYDSVKFIRYTG